MEKFFRFQKFDEGAGTVLGVMTAEEVDKSGEIFDYDGGGKAAVQEWSDEFARRTRYAGQELSEGNIRLQHRADTIAGKAVAITYDDQRKQIKLLSKLEEGALLLARKGLLTGYSIAGDFASRNCANCGADMMGKGNICPRCGDRVLVRFVPRIAEVSVVDNPCVPSATFQYVKADGSTELRKFAKSEEIECPYCGEEIDEGETKCPYCGREIEDSMSKSLTHHFKVAADHTRSLAKAERAISEGHRKLSSLAKNVGDLPRAKCHKAIAESHESKAAMHDTYVDHLVDQLSSRAAEATDAEVAEHGRSIRDRYTDLPGGQPSSAQGKVAKGNDFFSKFLYHEDAQTAIPSHNFGKSLFGG